VPTPRKTRKTRIQTSNVAPVRPRGLKKPSPQLARIIEFANLAGDAFLPEAWTWHSPGSLASADCILPERVRLHLLEVMHSPKEWKETPEKRVSDYAADGMKVGIDFARQSLQQAAGFERYMLIRSSRIVLRAIARGENSFEVFTYFERRIDSKGRHKAEFAGGDLGKALHKVDLRYIKACPVCDKIFFAGRINQDACDPATCAITLRKRRERANASDDQIKKRRKARKTRQKK
jgi:hypothetical protein